MTDSRKAPTVYHLFLPASHPFMKMPDAEFEGWWGPHVERHVVRPIPVGDGEQAPEEGK